MASAKDVLSEDELEALAEGVANGQVKVEGDKNISQPSVSLYDFHQPAHLLKARLPALEMVNERFAKDFQTNLFGFIQRLVEIEAEEVQLLKFADYLNSLPLTTSVNRVRVSELSGSILISVSGNLVYYFVDCFFGGAGAEAKISEDHEFTVTEKRIVERVLELAFQDLVVAWNPVAKLSFTFMHSETRTQLGAMSESSEVVVVSKFNIKANDVEGEISILIPHGLLEPLRPMLASGVKKGNADSDEHWRLNLRKKLEEVEIDINAVFAQAEITLGDLVSLKPGDFVPVNMSEQTVVCSEEVPIFEGKVGMSNQQAAVRVGQFYRH